MQERKEEVKRECVSVCETGVVGKEEIETMDVSEQESEKKGVKVSQREREGFLVRENGKCFRFHPSEREKARDVSCGWIKHLTQMHGHLPTKQVYNKGGRKEIRGMK